MPQRVVIVGGGAGGLELATKLGDRFGKKDRATVTLVDRSRTHLWKPLLHEVAAGSMDIHHNQLDYLAQARWHGFTFTLGPLTGLDRAARRITVGRVCDDEGREILPERTVAYDLLVVAIGSESNDFATPGVRDHAFMLDNAWQAHLFHRRLVNACFHANFRAAGDVIHIVIVGGGATGVELSAELHNTIRLLAAYGLENFHPATQIKLTLVEAGPRILPGLPDHVAEGALQTLRELGVDVMVKEKVVAATDAGIRTESGREVKATFIVWAAGIKCADVLHELGGLESNRLNQLVVKPTLQTTRDDEVFAIGDCAAAHWRKEPRLRLAGLPGQIRHVGPAHGLHRQREIPRRGLGREVLLHLALPPACLGAARFLAHGARYARAHDPPPGRAEGEAPLAPVACCLSL